MKSKVVKTFVNYFFKGLLFLAPVAITIWAILELFYLIDGLLQGTLINI